MWTDIEERPAPPRLAFLKMWVAPRLTVRALLDSGAERGAYVLAALAGVSRYSP